MNERIRELAEQAGVLMEDVLVDGVSVSKFIFPANQKFAELIVRECAKQCLSDDSMCILNHMGVKGVE